MKKMLAAALATIAFATGLTGCGNEKNNNVQDNNVEISTDMADNSENKAENDEKSNGTVEVTYPKQAYADYTEAQILGSAKTLGKETTAKINDDGSVTYTMTIEEQAKQLESLKSGLFENCEQLVSKGEYEFLKDISIDEELENITIKVDKASFEKAENIKFKVIERNCLGYQALKGVKIDDLKVVLHLIDEATGEEFNTEIYTAENIG